MIERKSGGEAFVNVKKKPRGYPGISVIYVKRQAEMSLPDCFLVQVFVQVLGVSYGTLRDFRDLSYRPELLVLKAVSLVLQVLRVQ
jgi:hypothetical protein